MASAAKMLPGASPSEHSAESKHQIYEQGKLFDTSSKAEEVEAKQYVEPDFASPDWIDFEHHIAEHGKKCTICQEDLTMPLMPLGFNRWVTHEPVKTECGHVFGANCLWTWFMGV